MIRKIRVKNIVGKDLIGEGILEDIRQLGIKSVTKVETAKVYRLEGISEKDAKVLAEKVFYESIYQVYTVNNSIFKVSSRLRGSQTSLRSKNNKPQIIEIAYKSGVMNPEVGSIKKAASDLGIKLIAADTSHEYGFFGPSTHSINTQGRTELNRSTTALRISLRST